MERKQDGRSLARVGATAAVVTRRRRAIAIAKALLIALLFMQLRNAAWLVRLAAMAGVIWVSFLYLIAFANYLTR